MRKIALASFGSALVVAFVGASIAFGTLELTSSLGADEPQAQKVYGLGCCSQVKVLEAEVALLAKAALEAAQLANAGEAEAATQILFEALDQTVGPCDWVRAGGRRPTLICRGL